MAERIIGTAAFVTLGLALKSTSKRKNAIDGESRVYIYTGTQTAVRNAYDILNLTDFLEAELDESAAPEYRLIVTSPDDSTTNSATNYELVGSNLMRDIFESARGRALGAQAIKQIKTAVNQDTAEPNFTGEQARFYKLYARGTVSWRYGEFVYRVTKIVSRRYTIKVAMNNINRIYKTTQVLNETQPPPGLVFSLNDVAADSTANGPADIPETANASGTIYGWIKGPPTVQRVAGYRLAITTEFERVEAESVLYTAA